MSVEFLETLAADLLKDNHLVCPAFIIEYGSLDYCTLYIRSTYLHGSVICDEKHLLELHISTLASASLCTKISLPASTLNC